MWEWEYELRLSRQRNLAQDYVQHGLSLELVDNQRELVRFQRSEDKLAR